METWVILLIALVVCLLLLLFSHLYRKKLQRLSLSIGVSQTKGLKENLEDEYALSHQSGATLAVVADGRGTGRVSGTLMADYAVHAFIRLFEPKSLRNPDYFFQSTARAANQTIRSRLNDGTGGASVIAAIFNGKTLNYASCGNACIGVLRKGELVLLNEGDTVKSIAKQHFYEGRLDRETAEAHQNNERLLRYIGMEGFDKMETGSVKLEANDVVALMTRGVANGLYWSELEALLNEQRNVQLIADAVISAVESGDMNHDNGTIMLLKFLGK